MTRLNHLRAALAVLVLAALIAGCSSDPVSGSGSVDIGGKSTFLLPPGHPGTIVGNTINLPEEATSPAVHTAYCFPGVINPGDIGVGSLIGEASLAVLPVNLNVGAGNVGSYNITISVSDPAVEINAGAIAGSRSYLATGSCIDRGCPEGCQDYPALFPNLYTRAPGFEGAPTVAGDSVSVTISATDSGPTPATGTVNLAMVPVIVTGPLPYGGVDITFTVNDLRNRSGNPVAFTAANPGIVIEKFHIVYSP